MYQLSMDEPCNEKQHEKYAEMDEFIYATSHDLRGPLATIKGLLNLLKDHKQVDAEHRFIVTQMNYFAQQLDDRLHKLIHFSQADKGHDSSTRKMTLAVIFERLRDDEVTYRMFPKVKLTSRINESSAALENAGLILAMLQNIKAFLLRLSNWNSELLIQATCLKDSVEFKMDASEILITDACRRKIDKANIDYTEILSDPEFTDLYSAKKIGLKLGAQLTLRAVDQSVQAHIVLPIR